MSKKLERLKTLLERKGGGRSRHYQEINDGLWVKPVKIGPRASAYPSDETEFLINARISGKSEDEMRELVKALMLRRKQFFPEEITNKTALKLAAAEELQSWSKSNTGFNNHSFDMTKVLSSSEETNS